MSFNPFKAPLALNIRPSRQKYCLIFVPHLSVLIFLLLSDVITGWLKLIISLLIISSLFYFYQWHLRLAMKQSVQHIFQDAANNWFITTPKYEQKPVEILPSSYIGRLLIIINFIDTDKNKYVALLTSDSLSKDDYRRLIVRIKLS